METPNTAQRLGGGQAVVFFTARCMPLTEMALSRLLTQHEITAVAHGLEVNRVSIHTSGVLVDEVVDITPNEITEQPRFVKL